MSFLTAVLMGVALCFHSLLEGAAMGAQPTIRWVLVAWWVGAGGCWWGGGVWCVCECVVGGGPCLRLLLCRCDLLFLCRGIVLCSLTEAHSDALPPCPSLLPLPTVPTPCCLTPCPLPSPLLCPPPPAGRSNSLHIFIAIVSHKGLAAYALGSSIVDSDVR